MTVKVTSVLGIPFSRDLLFAPDNTYNIGAAAANRPKNIYFGTSAVGTDNAAFFGLGASSDTLLYRDAADVFAMRRSTNAQTLRIYNTFTDASNYERGIFSWQTNTLYIGTEIAGTGSPRTVCINSGGIAGVSFRTNGATRFYIDGGTGHFLAQTDNTYDIGASGANRPRNLYLGGSSVIGGNYATGSSGLLVWTGQGSIGSSADGVIVLKNNAGTDFSRLQFGGTTNAFPALKRNGTGLELKNADDTGYALFFANALVCEATGYLAVNNRCAISSAADGTLALKNAAGTDFNRLQFGGTTNAFPSLKRAGTDIHAVLADDSVLTSIRMSGLRLFSGSFIGNPTDGVFLFQNSALTDVNRLQFGGTTSSFPALKRNSTTIQARLADDSGDAFLQARGLVTTATTVAGLPSASFGAGTRAFVTDATATTFMSVVAGGGANKVPVVSDGTNWLIG